MLTAVAGCNKDLVLELSGREVATANVTAACQDAIRVATEIQNLPEVSFVERAEGVLASVAALQARIAEGKEPFFLAHDCTASVRTSLPPTMARTIAEFGAVTRDDLKHE